MQNEKSLVEPTDVWNLVGINRCFVRVHKWKTLSATGLIWCLLSLNTMTNKDNNHRFFLMLFVYFSNSKSVVQTCWPWDDYWSGKIIKEQKFKQKWCLFFGLFSDLCFFHVKCIKVWPFQASETIEINHSEQIKNLYWTAHMFMVYGYESCYVGSQADICSVLKGHETDGSIRNVWKPQWWS